MNTERFPDVKFHLKLTADMAYIKLIHRYVCVSMSKSFLGLQFVLMNVF